MKKSAPHSEQRAFLLRLIEEGYDKEAWHGPNLRSTIRRVPVKEAVWRPRPGRHNIAEITVHCAYWKYAVRRRILDGKRGSFPLKGSNWFELPERLTEKQWREYVQLLHDTHVSLLETVATVPPARLSAKGGASALPAAQIYGVAMHDIYHAGQNRTIRVLYRQATHAKG